MDRLVLDWPIFEGKDIRFWLNIDKARKALRNSMPTAQEAVDNLREYFKNDRQH